MTREQATSSPPTLAYAGATAGEAIIEERDNGDVVVDLPPMTTLVYVTAITPWVFMLGFGGMLILVLLSGPRDVGGLWIFAPLVVALAGFWLWWFARHRGVRQVVKVERGVLSYANVVTGGSFWNLTAADCRRIRVRRCWWRPWTVQLQAEADVSFWSTRTHVEPVALLTATDATRLEQIAAIIRRSLYHER